jgi:hypothetical protein
VVSSRRYEINEFNEKTRRGKGAYFVNFVYFVLRITFGESMGRLLDIARAAVAELEKLAKPQPSLPIEHSASRQLAEESGGHRRKARSLPKSDATHCLYDWLPGSRGVRLRCVTHPGGHGPGATVIRIFYDGHDTLRDMFEKGVLTGQALADSLRPQ